MTEIYKNAFTEVCVILGYLDDESYFKIPKDIIHTIEINQNPEYQFYIDESIPFSEQKILEETKAILFNLYRDYLTDLENKKNILNYQNRKRLELEETKKEKYNPDHIFKEKSTNSVEKNLTDCQELCNNYIAIVKKQNIINKIIDKIKNLFHKSC